MMSKYYLTPEQFAPVFVYYQGEIFFRRETSETGAMRIAVLVGPGRKKRIENLFKIKLNDEKASNE